MKWMILILHLMYIFKLYMYLSFPGCPSSFGQAHVGFWHRGWASLQWSFTKRNSQLGPKTNVFSDATLNEAAQILRLLHIEELRELQTKINEAIVAVQAIIADPKTDHRLGKVGRWEDEESLRKKRRDWKLNICHWTQDYFSFAVVWKQIVWVGRSMEKIPHFEALQLLLICKILLIFKIKFWPFRECVEVLTFWLWWKYRNRPKQSPFSYVSSSKSYKTGRRQYVKYQVTFYCYKYHIL